MPQPMAADTAKSADAQPLPASESCLEDRIAALQEGQQGLSLLVAAVAVSTMDTAAVDRFIGALEKTRTNNLAAGFMGPIDEVIELLRRMRGKG